jgi:hypothetical protein
MEWYAIIPAPLTQRKFGRYNAVRINSEFTTTEITMSDTDAVWLWHAPFPLLAKA